MKKKQAEGYLREMIALLRDIRGVLLDAARVPNTTTWGRSLALTSQRRLIRAIPNLESMEPQDVRRLIDDVRNTMVTVIDQGIGQTHQ